MVDFCIRYEVWIKIHFVCVFNIQPTASIWKSISPLNSFYILCFGYKITTKVVEVMKFQLSYLKSWKVMLLKCYTKSICQQIYRTQQWPQEWKRSVFTEVPKKGNAKEYSDYHTIALISNASKFMLKILQARLQQDMNWELPDVQAGFQRGRGTRDQIENICWIFKKARQFEKNMYFCFLDSSKAFDSVDRDKLWKIPKEMGISHHLSCLLRNLYASQEGTIRTRYGTTDWFKTDKSVQQHIVILPI